LTANQSTANETHKTERPAQDIDFCTGGRSNNSKSYQTLSLFELCADAEPFSATEVAAILAPIIRHLALQHARDAGGHGNLTLASLAIHVEKNHDSTVHVPPPLRADTASAHVRCVSCMAPEDTESGESAQAADIWSVGIIAVQMLAGRQSAFAQCGGHCRELVHRRTGELPVMPNGISFECYDFLLDCLAPAPSERPSAARLLEHPYIHVIADISSAYSTTSKDILGVLFSVTEIDWLVHQLLICDDIKAKRAPFRTLSVPIHVAPQMISGETHLCFEAPSHTSRCNLCHPRHNPDESDSSPNLVPSSALQIKRKVCHSSSNISRTPPADSKLALTEFTYIPEHTSSIQCHKENRKNMLPSLLPDVAPPIWVVPLLENVAQVYEQLNILAGGSSLPFAVALD